MPSSPEKNPKEVRNCHAEPTLRETQFDTKILRLRKSDKKRESVDQSAPKSLYRKYHHRELTVRASFTLGGKVSVCDAIGEVLHRKHSWVKTKSDLRG